MDLEFRSDNFTFTDSTGGGVEISLSFKSYSLENLLLLKLLIHAYIGTLNESFRK